MTSSTLQDRFIDTNQTVEEPEKKQLLGSQLFDNIQRSLTGVGQSIVEASQDDPDTWTDDAVRLGLGGAKNVGNVLNAPGIKQALQALGAPAWIVGQGLGWSLEKAGVDPRYGHVAGEVGEWFIPFYGAGKLVKTARRLMNPPIVYAMDNANLAKRLGSAIPGNELGFFEDLPYYESSLGDILDLRGGRKRVYPASDIATAGEHVTEKLFTQEGKRLRNIVQNEFPSLKTPAGQRRILRDHHTAPLKQIAQSLNGLKDWAQEAGSAYLSKQLGFNLGMSPEQLSILPDRFHGRMHGLFNDLVGDGTYTLKGIERRTGKLINNLELWERYPVFDEIVDSINTTREAIYTFYESLATRSNLGTVTPEVYINSTLKRVELDKRLNAIKSKSGVKPSVKQILDDALGRSNEVLEYLTVLGNQTDIADPLYKFIMEDRGWEALYEAVTSSRAWKAGDDTQKVVSSAEIFKKYGIRTKQTTLDRLIVEINESDKALELLKLHTRSRRGGTPGAPDLAPGMFPED